MKIKSIDNKSWLSIHYCGDDDYAAYEVEVSIDIGHGHFTAKNSDQLFLNTEAFIEALAQFITNKNLAPRWHGTYGTYVEFYSPGPNVVMLAFSIGDAFCGYAQGVDYALSGAFEINQENLLPLLAFLHVK